jgi:hypothetical protein
LYADLIVVIISLSCNGGELILCIKSAYKYNPNIPNQPNNPNNPNNPNIPNQPNNPNNPNNPNIPNLKEDAYLIKQSSIMVMVLLMKKLLRMLTIQLI